jgi:hypothetical protein
MWGNQRIRPSVPFPWNSTRLSESPHAVLKPHEPIIAPGHHQPPFYRSAFHLAVCGSDDHGRYTPTSIQDLFLCSFVCASIADGARDGIFGLGRSAVGRDGLAEEFHWICHSGRVQWTIDGRGEKNTLEDAFGLTYTSPTFLIANSRHPPPYPPSVLPHHPSRVILTKLSLRLATISVPPAHTSMSIGRSPLYLGRSWKKEQSLLGDGVRGGGDGFA